MYIHHKHIIKYTVIPYNSHLIPFNIRIRKTVVINAFLYNLITCNCTSEFLQILTHNCTYDFIQGKNMQLY